MTTPKREDFRYAITIPTRWLDVDVYGHVNNVVYYAYFDTVINRFLVDEGKLDVARDDAIGVCAESQCTYVRSVGFPDELTAAMRVAKIGTTSVTYEIAIFRGDALSAHGRFVHVFVDRTTRTPTPIPEKLRTALARLT
jgi:acyl-CoA thioester hydrolase